MDHCYSEGYENPTFQAPNIGRNDVSATFLAANPTFHGRSKHIEVDIHFVRGKIAWRLIEVQKLSAKEQLADGFTKHLSIDFIPLRQIAGAPTFNFRVAVNEEVQARGGSSATDKAAHHANLEQKYRKKVYTHW